MVTPQAQIKINLPLALKDFLESKANKFGMPVAVYVKHLILKEVEDMEYPEYEMSEKAEKIYKEALRDRKNAIKVKGDIKTFLQNL